ncbi:hypothetical protein [Alcanivorax sp.]|nr:hypothetical protein [Alcanivorax sp.]
MYSVIILGTDIVEHFKPLIEALEIAEHWREQGYAIKIVKED